jgi:hypothetical protein
MTDEQFDQRILDIIAREFGVGGLARFIRLSSSGHGDYTAERHQWLDGLTVEDILRDIDQRQKQPQAK